MSLLAPNMLKALECDIHTHGLLVKNKLCYISLLQDPYSSHHKCDKKSCFHDTISKMTVLYTPSYPSIRDPSLNAIAMSVCCTSQTTIFIQFLTFSHLRHSVNKFILDVLLPLSPPPPRHKPTSTSTPSMPNTSSHDSSVPTPPQHYPHHTRNSKPSDCQKHPMLPHPKDRPRILSMPTTAFCDIKETPRMTFILVTHQNPDVILWRPIHTHPFLPHHT